MDCFVCWVVYHFELVFTGHARTNIGHKEQKEKWRMYDLGISVDETSFSHGCTCDRPAFCYPKDRRRYIICRFIDIKLDQRIQLN